MIAKGPAVPTAVATAILSVVIGGVVGFFVRDSQVKPGNGAGSPPGMSAQAGGGGGGGGGQGGGAGGGGRGGPPAPSPKRDLTGLVRNLGTLEVVQSKGLTAEQKKTLAPILKDLQAAPKLTDDLCKPEIAKIEAVLTSDQKDAIKALTPQRGGGGGRGGGGAPGGGGPGGGGGGGMVAGQDPDKPFAAPQNKKALEDLITVVQK